MARSDDRADLLFRPRWSAWLLGTAVVLTAFFVRQGLGLVFGPDFPRYVTFYAAVTLIAVFIDWHVALLGTALSALLALVYVLEPANPADFAGVVVFLGLGVLISAGAGLYRRSSMRLRESQEKFSKSFFASNGFMIITEAETDRIMEINPAACVLTGYDREEVLGRTSVEVGLITPEQRRRVMEAVARHQRVHNAEGTARCRSGEVRNTIYSVEPIELHRKPYLLITGRDITERRRAEQALRRSRDTLQAVLDAAPAGVVLADPQGKVILSNSATARILGSEVTGDAHGPAGGYELTRMDGAPVRRGDLPLSRALNGQTVADRELRVVRPDGTEVFILTSATPLRDESGAVTAAVSVFLDITLRTRAQQALRDSEERFRALADNMPQLAWMADASGRIFWFNKRWFQYAGIPSGEMQDARWRETIHPEYLPRIERAFGQSAREGRTWEDTFPMLGGDGEYRWFLTRATPIRDAQGHVCRYFGTMTDVTDLRELQEQNRRLLESERLARSEAEQASRMKDDFLSTVSHELRTPLTAMLGWSEILKDPKRRENRLDRGLDAIQQAATSQAKIVDDLLDISRVVRGKLGMTMEELDLTDVVRASVEAAASGADDKGLELTTDFQAEAMPALGDAGRLRQVFDNLLSNALKFTRRGGSIHVQTRVVDTQAEVTVKDTGVGIDPELLPRLFNRFRQGEQQQKQQAGLGLGLALVRHLTEAHGGTAEADSAGRGKGATFTIRLPLARAPEQAAPRPAELRPAARQLPEGLEVLVVEDHPATQELMALALQEAGSRVRTAASAAEALERLDEACCQVLVSDIGLPDEDGYDLMRRIRQRPPERGGDVAAVAVTAYTRLEDRQRALAAGYQRHLPKPIDGTMLVAVVAGLWQETARRKAG